MVNRGKLNNLTGVRREMIRIYMQGRDGFIETKDMARLVNALNLIANLIVLQKREEDIEQRLAALESQCPR